MIQVSCRQKSFILKNKPHTTSLSNTIVLRANSHYKKVIFYIKFSTLLSSSCNADICSSEKARMGKSRFINKTVVIVIIEMFMLKTPQKNNTSIFLLTHCFFKLDTFSIIWWPPKSTTWSINRMPPVSCPPQ